MLNRWEPVMSLVAGMLALCLDRWYDPESGFWFYLGMGIIVVETFRLGTKIRATS